MEIIHSNAYKIQQLQQGNIRSFKHAQDREKYLQEQVFYKLHE